jgi:hypothetical protein
VHRSLRRALSETTHTSIDDLDPRHPKARIEGCSQDWEDPHRTDRLAGGLLKGGANSLRLFTPADLVRRKGQPRKPMVRIAITQAAFDAIVATLPVGSTGYENKVNEKGERLIWLERRMLDKLNSYRRAGESYSDVILRLAGEGG